MTGIILLLKTNFFLKTIIRSAIGSVASTGFLKFLKEKNFRIIGTDVHEKVVGKYYVDAFYSVPYASNEKEVIELYNTISKKENAEWIISGPESEVEVLIKNRDRLISNVFHLPHKTFELLSNKLSLFKNLKKMDLKTPETSLIEENTYKGFKGEKVILKPQHGRGSKGVYIVNKNSIPLYLTLLGEERHKYIVQEFINGREISVDTLHDFQGKILNVVSRYRLNTESGISTTSATFRDKKLFDIIKKVSSRFEFYGANCIQFIKDKNSNDYYLTDVNPRFGGGSILSLKASPTMQSNLSLLLNNEESGYIYENYDYSIISMFRGYKEIYI